MSYADLVFFQGYENGNMELFLLSGLIPSSRCASKF